MSQFAERREEKTLFFFGHSCMPFTLIMEAMDRAIKIRGKTIISECIVILV